MRAQNEPPETAVRTPDGPLVVDTIPPEWVESGYAWPQSRGSQLAGAAVGARPGERVLDLCAAPGGKATQLAAAGAEVVAVEKHAGRARELEENARRLGVALTVVNADALELPDDLGGFDRALVDAPCSGLGVLNSRPDLRWRGEPLPSSSSPSSARRPSACARGHDHVRRLHDQPRRRTRTSSTRSASRSRISARTGRSTGTRGGPSSCSRSPTSTGRRASSSPGSGRRT